MVSGFYFSDCHLGYVVELEVQTYLVTPTCTSCLLLHVLHVSSSKQEVGTWDQTNIDIPTLQDQALKFFVFKFWLSSTIKCC